MQVEFDRRTASIIRIVQHILLTEPDMRIEPRLEEIQSMLRPTDLKLALAITYAATAPNLIDTTDPRTWTVDMPNIMVLKHNYPGERIQG